MFFLRFPPPTLLLTTAFFLLVIRSPAHGQRWENQAAKLRWELEERILPYWFDTAVDWRQGGYLLDDHVERGRAGETRKHVVTQARMVWTFAHAHRNGFGGRTRNYLRAAEHGFRFLQKKFRDRRHGGYFLMTDLEGRVIEDRKSLYTQSFVIYAFVEYYRASGRKAALREALKLFRLTESRSRDPANGSWNEHFFRDWSPMTTPQPKYNIEIPGLKSANASLHWMEALAELYAEAGDENVRKALTESLAWNKEIFYPAEPGRSLLHIMPDGRPVRSGESRYLSYGHNVEFAWLMLRAEQVLGLAPDWTHFHAELDHALAHGFDWARGGVYSRGEGNRPASDIKKTWWAQAEMMAALATALAHDGNNARYDKAARLLFSFINRRMKTRPAGIWIAATDRHGRIAEDTLAGVWKANYHDVRAMILFANLCGRRRDRADRFSGDDAGGNGNVHRIGKSVVDAL